MSICGDKAMWECFLYRLLISTQWLIEAFAIPQSHSRERLSSFDRMEALGSLTGLCIPNSTHSVGTSFVLYTLTQAGHKFGFLIILTLPPGYWDLRCASLYLVYEVHRSEPRISVSTRQTLLSTDQYFQHLNVISDYKVWLKLCKLYVPMNMLRHICLQMHEHVMCVWM